MNSPFNLGSLMENLSGNLGQFKAKVEESLQKSRSQTVSAKAGGDMVTVFVNGAQEVVKIEINPETFQLGDKSMLEDLIAAATNQALKQSKDFMQQELQKAVSNLGLPLPPGMDISKLLNL